MDCPICGHKMEENDSFCSNCGHYALPLQNDDRTVPVIESPPDTPTEGSTVISPCPGLPVEPAEPPKKVAERLYPPPEPQDAASTPENDAKPEPDPLPSDDTVPPASKKPQPVKEEPGHRRLKVLAVVLGCITVIAVAAASYILYNTSSLRVQLSKAQKESLTAQSQAANMESQITALTDNLATAKEENSTLAAQVADLTGQVGELETSVNQTQYDKAAAQRDLEEAKTALATAQEEKTALEAQLTEAQTALTQAQTDLEEAQEENETLQDQNDAYRTEVSFYDTYVVFVMLSSSDKYYHKYDCSLFTQKNFVAYSTKLAEANGYSPCPNCIG